MLLRDKKKLYKIMLKNNLKQNVMLKSISVYQY